MSEILLGHRVLVLDSEDTIEKNINGRTGTVTCIAASTASVQLEGEGLSTRQLPVQQLQAIG